MGAGAEAVGEDLLPELCFAVVISSWSVLSLGADGALQLFLSTQPVWAAWVGIQMYGYLVIS